MVVYGSSARTALPLTPGSAQDKLLLSVQGLKSEGATNMEAGLQAAYRLAQSAKPGHEKRLLLFTDVQPNVGATGATEFQDLAREGASGGVGLTVFGVGVGLGPETFSALSKVRGGNAFTLFGSRDVNKVLSEDWPFLASPVAYDLRLTVTPSPGLEVAEGYGFPTAERVAELNTSTVFLSKRRGALLVRLATAEPAPFSVIGDLSYQTPSGETVLGSLSSSYDGAPLAEGRYFAQPSVAKTVALAVLVSNMQKSARLYGNDPEQAVSLMGQTARRFKEDSHDDPDLAPEVQLAERLLELMKQGAEQGTLYGL